MMEMTWLLMWLNVSVATLNATLQLLVLYRFEVPWTRTTDEISLLKSYKKEEIRAMDKDNRREKEKKKKK